MKGASEGIYSGFEPQRRNHMKPKIELSQFPQKTFTITQFIRWRVTQYNSFVQCNTTLHYCFISFRCGIKFVRQIDEFNTCRHSGRSGTGWKTTET